jgi:hypothetical protein
MTNLIVERSAMAAMGGGEKEGRRMEKERKERLRHFAQSLRRVPIFLFWIRRNPLKSPDSDE